MLFPPQNGRSCVEAAAIIGEPELSHMLAVSARAQPGSGACSLPPPAALSQLIQSPDTIQGGLECAGSIVGLQLSPPALLPVLGCAQRNVSFP